MTDIWVPVMVTPECGERWKRASSDRMAAMRGVAGSGRLAGLAPSDQQVTLRGGASSSDSVEPGSSWPWCGCFLNKHSQVISAEAQLGPPAAGQTLPVALLGAEQSVRPPARLLG